MRWYRRANVDDVDRSSYEEAIEMLKRQLADSSEGAQRQLAGAILPDLVDVIGRDVQPDWTPRERVMFRHLVSIEQTLRERGLI